MPTTEPGTAAVVDVPATVDPTGSSDVTAALQAILDAAPNGATIRFARAATYRVDGTLRLRGRSGLLIDGAGATLHPTTVADYERRTWSLLDSSDIKFVDLLIRGAHPDGGTYVPAHEHEHGFGIEGGGRITIERVRITDAYGDCVYVSNDEAGTWADGVQLHRQFVLQDGTQWRRGGRAVATSRWRDRHSTRSPCFRWTSSRTGRRSWRVRQASRSTTIGSGRPSATTSSRPMAGARSTT